MLSIAEAAKRLATGTTTSVALTREALARGRDPNGEGARTFTVLFDEAALAEAEASDRLRAVGIVPSPLAGIPISIKDLLDVRGRVTTAGAPFMADMPPAKQDATIVARLRAAGAVIVGRTNMPEFASSSLGLNRGYGTPRNPWDRKTGRVPGGSSSGAGISVTDGMALAAIGSDTGGSIRIPAALVGIVGFKPTQKRVPLDGCFPLSNSLDSLGPLGASVACCALIDAVLAGEPAGVPDAVQLQRLTFAVPRKTYLFDELDPTVSRAFERAVVVLSDAGARIIDVDLPSFTVNKVGFTQRPSFVPAEVFSVHRPLLAEKQSRYDPRILANIAAGASVTAADYLTMVEERRAVIAEIGRALDGFDGILAPTAPAVAPTIASVDGDDAAYHKANGFMARNTAPVNMLDGCGLSIPCHEPGTGPVGLMLAGLAGSDRRILAAGLSVEAVLTRALQ